MARRHSASRRPLHFTDREKRIFFPSVAAGGKRRQTHRGGRREMQRKLFLDVGGHYGETAVVVLGRDLAFDAVHTFEPDPECFSKLERTFERFSIPGRCSDLALSDKAGTSTFNIYDNRANNSMLSRHDFRDAGGRAITVSCSTLDLMDEQLRVFRRPMLKLDVQGHELAVLKGGQSLLKRCEYVHLEVSSHHAYEGNSHVAELFCAMRDNGFRWVEILDTLRQPRKEGYCLKEADLLFVNDAQ